MAQCEVCGNDYYLSFEVVTAGNRHVFDFSSALSINLRPFVHTAGAKLSVTASRRKRRFSAAPTAPGSRA